MVQIDERPQECREAIERGVGSKEINRLIVENVRSRSRPLRQFRNYVIVFTHKFLRPQIHTAIDTTIVCPTECSMMHMPAFHLLNAGYQPLKPSN